MKEYILTGDPAEVEKVIRENRIRISRGVISITPAEPESSEERPTDVEAPMDDKNIDAGDLKEVDLDADTKEAPAEDVKDASVEDVKEITTPKKTSGSKKTE